jgi:predicted nucleic acid-binding protein
MRNESIYLETSVISYYAAKQSRDVIVLAHQEITHEVWEKLKKKFKIYISEVVVEEAGSGDKEASKKRLTVIKDFPLLELTDEVEKLTEKYIKEFHLPKRALRDAVHLAIACVHNIDYLVSWNCAHIANAEVIKKLTAINKKLGIHIPVICTPEFLEV